MPVLFAPLSARIVLVFAISVTVLAIALLSQYWGGLLPCALCLKQRVAFYVAVPLLALAYFYAARAPLAMRGLLTTIGIIFWLMRGLVFTMPVLNMVGGWDRPPAAAGLPRRSIRARFLRLCKAVPWCAVMPQPSPYSGFHWPVIMFWPVWLWPDWLCIKPKAKRADNDCPCTCPKTG